MRARMGSPLYGPAFLQVGGDRRRPGNVLYVGRQPERAELAPSVPRTPYAPLVHGMASRPEVSPYLNSLSGPEIRTWLGGGRFDGGLLSRFA